MRYQNLKLFLKKKRFLTLIIAIPCGLILILSFIRFLSFDPNSVSVNPKSITILDRNGETLHTISESKTVSLYAKLEDISPSCINALISAEDKNFYSNFGVDPAGIVRSLFGEIIGTNPGGSTITQQLVKITRENQSDRTLVNKVNEAIDATRLNFSMSKEDILEKYLNTVNFGNSLYGIETASQNYFDKTSKNLTLSECAYLVGVINKPAIYNPYSDLDSGLNRMKVVLDLMEKNDYINSEENHYAKSIDLKFENYSVEVRAPHVTKKIVDELENILKENHISREQIAKVETTYDYELHKKVVNFAAEQVRSLEKFGANNASIVALENGGGIILYVGSTNFFDRTSGNFNHAESRIQVGSTMKPFLYSLAFFKGYIPASVVLDEKTSFNLGFEFSDFIPQNADLKTHGIQTIRYALGNSYNIPAMVIANRIGVEPLVETLSYFDFKSLKNPSSCGIVLAVGACEVTLLDLVKGYSAFPNEGKIFKTYLIKRIISNKNEILWERKDSDPVSNLVDLMGEQTPAIMQMITHILSDNDARREVFGSISNLRTAFPSAVKTGTTQNHKDVLTVGYTTEHTVGVWVGNSQGVNMDVIHGSDGAAPIWNFAILNIRDSHEEFKFDKLQETQFCLDNIGENIQVTDLDINSVNQGFKNLQGCKNISIDVVPKI